MVSIRLNLNSNVKIPLYVFVKQNIQYTVLGSKLLTSVTFPGKALVIPIPFLMHSTILLDWVEFTFICSRLLLVGIGELSIRLSDGCESIAKSVSITYTVNYTKIKFGWVLELFPLALKPIFHLTIAYTPYTNSIKMTLKVYITRHQCSTITSIGLHFRISVRHYSGPLKNYEPVLGCTKGQYMGFVEQYFGLHYEQLGHPTIRTPDFLLYCSANMEQPPSTHQKL